MGLLMQRTRPFLGGKGACVPLAQHRDSLQQLLVRSVAKNLSKLDQFFPPWIKADLYFSFRRCHYNLSHSPCAMIVILLILDQCNEGVNPFLHEDPFGLGGPMGEGEAVQFDLCQSSFLS